MLNCEKLNVEFKFNIKFPIEIELELVAILEVKLENDKLAVVDEE